MKTPKVYISFNTPYAAKQHEDTTLNHPVGQSKYLETAYMNKKQTIMPQILDVIRKSFK